jgi:hypothetical protein
VPLVRVFAIAVVCVYLAGCHRAAPAGEALTPAPAWIEATLACSVWISLASRPEDAPPSSGSARSPACDAHKNEMPWS